MAKTNWVKVEIPEGLVKQHNNKTGVTWLYYTVEKRYDKEKQYNSNKRRCVGKAIDEKFMYANEYFFELFPEKCVDSNKYTKSGTINIGLFILIQAIIKELQLDLILEKAYGKVYKILLDVAMYMLVSENNVIQHFPDYEYDHQLFNESSVTDSRVCEIFKELDIREHEQFLGEWNKLQDKGTKVYLTYDGTNVNTDSESISLAEFGHAKIDKGNPIINTGAAFNEQTGTPMFFENYPGSIIDNVQFEKTIERANSYGFKNIGFMTDKGFFSKTNLNLLENSGYEFIMMAKNNVKFVKESIDEAVSIFENNTSYYNAKEHAYMMTIKRKLYTDDKTEKYVHVIYDKRSASYDEDELLGKIEEKEEIARQIIGSKNVDKKICKELEKYFKIEYNDKNEIISIVRDEEKIKKLLKRCGCCVIISSEEMSAIEARHKYRNRDSIEKFFMISKTFMGEDVFRVHSDESLESKQMVVFIGQIIRSKLFNATEQLKEKDNKNYTIPAIIKEMEKVQLIENINGNYRVRYNLTGKQKEIIRAIGIDEIEFMEIAKNICEDYRKNI